MDRFLAKTRSGPRSLSRSLQDTHTPDKMVGATDAEEMEDEGATASAEPTKQTVDAGTRDPAMIDYEQLAKAVALQLKPMIQEAVDTAVQQGLAQLRQEMAASGKRMGGIENRISGVEDDMHDSKTILASLETTVQQLTLKLDDLENRNRRNNIRVVGLSEQYKASDLKEICEQLIPKAFGIKTICTVKRAQIRSAESRQKICTTSDCKIFKLQ